MWYFETVKTAFRRRLTYRAATAAGLATNMFFGFVRAYILAAVVAAKGETIGGYTEIDMYTYTCLTQALLSYLNVFGWSEIGTAIKTGEIVTDYTKPVSIFALYQARDIGKSLHELILRGTPLYIGYAFIMPIQFPKSVTATIFFFLSLTLAWSICFSWRFAVSCTVFWTLDIRGTGTILFSIAMLLMGFIVPVELFPPWLKTIAMSTPFPSIVQTPVNIYLGHTEGAGALHAIGIQVLWTAAAACLAFITLKLGAKRLVVQGG